MKERNSIRQRARLLKLLSHPARLRILDELRRDEACVCHLQAVLNRRQPYISQQLRALRDAGVVRSRREGTFLYYRLTDPGLVRILDVILGPAGQPRHPSTCTCPECESVNSAEDTDPMDSADSHVGRYSLMEEQDVSSR